MFMPGDGVALGGIQRSALYVRIIPSLCKTVSELVIIAPIKIRVLNQSQDVI